MPMTLRYFVVIIGLLCASLCASPVSLIEHTNGDMSVTGIYGSCEITDSLLCEIIRSPEFQRLKGVHQYGPWCFVVGPTDYTRWEHSLGVFQLTVQYGGSYYEQIAALLHDVSHTVFSHVGGWIYHSDYRIADRHQDDIHGWFIENSSIAHLLSDYGIDPEVVHHKGNGFAVLEQPLPDICADRLDYNLQGAYYEGLASQEDIDFMLASLHFHDGYWYFDNVDAARMFAHNSVCMTRNIWGSPSNGIIYRILGSLLRYAVDTGLLTQYDIHFSHDADIWQRLQNADDTYIHEYLFLLNRHHTLTLYDPEMYDFWVQAKFRGIDPWVLVDNQYMRLSAYDSEFARLYGTTYEAVTSGWPVRCLYKKEALWQGL